MGLSASWDILEKTQISCPCCISNLGLSSP